MSICRWVTWWADRTPGNIAIRFEDQEITYAEFASRVAKVASILQGFKIHAGDRVAWVGYNSPEFLIALFACARIGAIIVPLNFRLAPREHLFMVNNSGANLLFFDPRLSATAKFISTERQTCVCISTSESDFEFSKSSLTQLLAIADMEIEGEPPPIDTPLLIIYTSGTTGRPKGAVLTQRAIHWNGLNSQLMHDLRRNDHILTTLPFSHVGGLNIQTTPALQVGATVTLIEKFHAGQFLSMVAKLRPTLTVLVPTQMRAISMHPDWRNADLSSLRCVTTGSTVVQVPLLNIWHDHDIPVIQIYGCTESAPIAIHQVLESAQTSAGSVGRPAMYCDVKVVTPSGVSAADDEVGEIVLRGPNIMREYWQDETATTSSMKFGWLQTGDIGYRDTHGNFYIVDRKKRVIISGGENIYPSELERILLEHPDIKEAVVVGHPNDKWGEVPVVAFVSDSISSRDSKLLADLFEGRVGHLKHPHHYILMDSLPKNAMGKVVIADVQMELRKRIGD